MGDGEDTVLTSTAAIEAADEALRVIARHGLRGLTGDDVFATPEAQMQAAVERLTALDLDEFEGMIASVGMLDMSPAEAGALIAGVVTLWTEHVEDRTRVRFELFMEARRRPDFGAELERVRLGFAHLTREFLACLGCRDLDGHVLPTMMFIDGLTFNQLLYGDLRASPEELRDSLTRWFESC